VTIVSSRQRVLRILAGCWVLLLAGCSGSSEMIDAPAGRPTDEEVGGVLRQVVLPAVDRLAAFSPVNQPAPPRAGSGRSDDGECARFDLFCSGGGFEVCQSVSAGPVTFRYESCARPVGLVDGVWVLDQSGLDATAEFDLSIDALMLSGRIDYTLDDMCWRKRFDSFTAVGPDYGATIDGTVDYCFAAGSENGRLEISVNGPRGSFDLSLDFDSGSGTVLAVRDALTTTCTVDLRAAGLDCREN